MHCAQSLSGLKQGATFQLVGPFDLMDGPNRVTDFSAFSVSSQVRKADSSAALVATLTSNISPDGIVTLEGPTDSWPVDVPLAMDVRIVTPSGAVVYTDTVTFTIERSETEANP